MESPTKQYKSIEASVFAIDAHYGEGKDVKYWRSKMRRYQCMSIWAIRKKIAKRRRQRKMLLVTETKGEDDRLQEDHLKNS